MQSIGIVVAQWQEAAPLVRTLENRRKRPVGSFTMFEGDIGGKSVSIIISGVGRRAAQGAASALIKSVSPAIVISSGFAGGLLPDYPAGTIVVSRELVDDAGLREIFPTRDALFSVPPAKTGVVLTSSRFVSSVRHRRELNERTRAVAVDMESIHVARVSREAGIPFLVVRVISDDLSAELPVMAEIFTRDGRLSVMRAISYFLRHPRFLLPFVRFMRNLDAHAVSLARYLTDLIVRP